MRRTVYSRGFLVALVLLSAANMWAKDVPKREADDFIMHHVRDAHHWHFVTVGHTHVTLPLPIIIYAADGGLQVFSSNRFVDIHHQRVAYQGYVLNDDERITALDQGRVFYDLSITKNVAAMLVSVLMLLTIFLVTARRYRHSPQIAPHGFWALLEMLICFVRDEVAIPNIGSKHYKRFMPYLLSMFFFIWLNNLLGLLPGAANVTGNISVTLVLALFTFILTNLSGNKHYWGHILNTPGVPRWLAPIMIPVELLGLLTKPFALMVRLFANITAGHIILLSIIGLVFSLKSTWVGFISVPFGAFMFLLKLLVAFLQAYIFTLLSAIYLGAAVGGGHEQEEVDG
ncbi:MAG: F0F1 ATP synthase subunit A [Amoebophilaceae bacterium]|nr:F0F1 ATP synthase subunit A [Amoebophilaceae bacterium]